MAHNDYDALRPDKESSHNVLTYSRSTWQGLLHSAQYKSGLPDSCCNIRALLNKTPSIPQSSSSAIEIADDHLYLEGYSKWSVLPDESLRVSCELPPFKDAVSRHVCIGSLSSNACDLSGSISDWPSIGSRGNYLSVFVLGWSYVISAHLIELRRTSSKDNILYTNSMATHRLGSEDATTNYFDLEVPSDNPNEIRWWAAILAPAQGWRATLTRGDTEYYAPWESHLKSSPFRICNSAGDISNHPLEAPSSFEARQYLLNLARFYNSFDQLIWAFAAVLTLPMRNRLGASIALPSPVRGTMLHQDTEAIYGAQVPNISELSHYMAFSGTSGAITSCLFGSFREPGIPCNLVSEWLNPLFQEVFPRFLQSKRYCTIVRAMSDRQPSVASLWVGSAITGLLPRIFQISQACIISPPCLEAAVWSTSPQSFMDPKNHRQVPVQIQEGLEMIPREDEFRLLFKTDTESKLYGEPPISPYPPFGWVTMQDTSIEVRLHLRCNHRLTYHSWNWKCRDMQHLGDFGKSYPQKPSGRSFLKDNLLQSVWAAVGFAYIGFLKPRCSGSLLPIAMAIACILPRTIRFAMFNRLISPYIWLGGALSKIRTGFRQNITSSEKPQNEEYQNDEFSEVATQNVFSWTFFSEGTRSEEKHFWDHEWLEILPTRQARYDPSDSSSSETELEASIQKMECIENWRDETERIATDIRECRPSA